MQGLQMHLGQGVKAPLPSKLKAWKRMMLRADGEVKMKLSEQHNGKAEIVHEGLSDCWLIAYLWCRCEKAVGSQGAFLFLLQALLCANGMWLFVKSSTPSVLYLFLHTGEEGHTLQTRLCPWCLCACHQCHQRVKHLLLCVISDAECIILFLFPDEGAVSHAFFASIEDFAI